MSNLKFLKNVIDLSSGIVDTANSSFDLISSKIKDKKVFDKLKQLKGLMDEGIITQEEFETEKAKLLK